MAETPKPPSGGVRLRGATLGMALGGVLFAAIAHMTGIGALVAYSAFLLASAVVLGAVLWVGRTRP